MLGKWKQYQKFRLKMYRRMVVNVNRYWFRNFFFQVNSDISKNVLFLQRFHEDSCIDHLCAGIVLCARNTSMDTVLFLPSNLKS